MSYYDFIELARKAFDDPVYVNIENLGLWCDSFGESLWNGEYFDVSLPGEPSGSRRLFPVSEYDELWNSFITVGYELR